MCIVVICISRKPAMRLTVAFSNRVSVCQTQTVLMNKCQKYGSIKDLAYIIYIIDHSFKQHIYATKAEKAYPHIKR